MYSLRPTKPRIEADTGVMAQIVKMDDTAHLGNEYGGISLGDRRLACNPRCACAGQIDPGSKHVCSNIPPGLFDLENCFQNLGFTAVTWDVHQGALNLHFNKRGPGGLVQSTCDVFTMSRCVFGMDSETTEPILIKCCNYL